MKDLLIPPSGVQDRPTRLAPAYQRPMLARLAARCSGTLLSLLIHGGLIALALLGVAAPRAGRGGGIVGSPDVASGPPVYSALIQNEASVDPERSPDARVFPQATPEPPETPEALPPAPDDFIKEQSDTGIPVAKIPPPSDARPKRSTEKLPPSGGSENRETADGPPESGGDQKGNSTVNGTGGDTGGAGDGTLSALYMPAPDYPASARRKNIEGIVVIAVEVHPDGHCENAHVVEASGCEALDDAALTAIRKWKYEAHPDEGTVVRRVRFVFRLKK